MPVLIVLAYTPFSDPLPIWVRNWIWPLLLLPLCLALSVVYKSIRCHSMKQVPRQAAELFIMIVVGMFLAAMALAGVAWFMD
jgi:hypothetical protein